MERIGPWLQTSWDHRAAGNFIGGGTGSGLAIVAAADALWTGQPQRFPFALAALVIAIGLGLVWLEIGRPWRFLHVFFHPRTSWMTRESLLAPPLLLALAAAAWTVHRAPAGLAAPLALAFLYCQARILRAASGIPAWREPAIVPLMLATGLAEGVGAFLVLTVLSGAPSAPPALLLALAAIGARWFAWVAYRHGLKRSGAPTGALEALAALQTPVLALGTIAPLALAATALILSSFAGALVLVAGALALGGGWIIKDVIVTRASFNQGFALPHLPRLGAAAKDSSARPGWS
jgi:phenylacetyl-CoA:acceptor oxidoreductase 26-kDa subunit